MGNKQPSQPGQILSQTPLVQPLEPPYPGPAAQYHCVNVEVTMSNTFTYGFNSTRLITSNVDAYYPVLAQPYSQGFRLLSFYHIPGQVQRTGGFFSRDVLMPFQGIFCRYPQVQSNESFTLKIEKSMIQPQFVWNGILSLRSEVVTDTSHLYQTIANNTQNGGRLICIELTGQEEQHASFNLNRRQPLLGCDLFFEIPLNGGENYIYNVVSIPISVKYNRGFRLTPTVECDFLGVMACNLAQGYKLVEIFMDHTQNTQTADFIPMSTLNSQWFFEKPASCINDPTPLYQGTIVEHRIEIKANFSGVRTNANWEPVLQEMGNRGWELACILETPEIEYNGINSVLQRVLLFFQRRIIY